MLCNQFKPSSKIFFTDSSKAVLLLWIIDVSAHLFIDALWSPPGKGLNSWRSFVMSNCEVVKVIPLNKAMQNFV